MSRKVVLGFSSDDEARRFLDYIHSMDDHARTLLTANRLPDGKVKLNKFRIKSVHIREES